MPFRPIRIKPYSAEAFRWRGTTLAPLEQAGALRIFIYALALMLALAGSLCYWRASQSIEVRVAKVERADIQLGYDEDGVVRSDVEAVVAAKGAGRVRTLDVRDGETVRAGQTIATLDAA